MSEPARVFVRPNAYLTLHYRITLCSGAGKGEVFADTYGGRPATLQLGSGQWAQAMEAPLLGRAQGESFSFEVPAAQAYGARNPQLLQKVQDQIQDLINRNVFLETHES